MDIIVDRPQLVRTVLLYLKMNLGDLTPKTTKKYPELVSYVNPSNEVMMEYDKEAERVYINYDEIWLKIESLFHLNYDDTKSVIRVWLEEKPYELVGVTPWKGVRYLQSNWTD